MLLHKTRYLDANPSPNGAESIDHLIEEILQNDLKDQANGIFARLVAVAITPIGGNRIFVTVLAER